MKLAVEHVDKAFGKVVALRDVNLQVEEGEYVAIVGPSGCGKSTLLKVIMGIIRQDHGSIIVDGKDVSDLPPEDRNLGFVFQDILLFPHMTAYENIAYSPLVRDFERQLRKQFVEELFIFGRIDQWRNNYPAEISSRGIQQKVSLIRALATGAKLLLLDEPLSSLDSRVRISLRAEVRKIVKQLGVTAIHVTHDQEEAMTVADRIVVMKKGSIVEVGTPEELYSRPKNIFTAYFLGKGNFVPAKIVARKDDGDVAKAEGLTFVSRTGLQLGGECVVFFRPENVTFERKGYNNFSGRVVEKRFTGRHIEYIVETKGVSVMIRTMRNEDPSYQIGDIADFHVEKEDIVIYRHPEEGLESAFRLE
ncbi:MAG: ABC transporter ATP-binding protein [Nitrososphaeria archaeon]